jgi:hypothetical protein
VKLHQHAQDNFRLGHTSFGDKQVQEISSFVALIRVALNAAKKNQDDGIPPLDKEQLPHRKSAGCKG